MNAPRRSEGVEMIGVREYAESMDVRLVQIDSGRWVVKAYNEAGYNVTLVDVADLLVWLHQHRPDLLAVDRGASAPPAGPQ